MSIAKSTTVQASDVPSSGSGKPSPRVLFWGGVLLAIVLIPIFAMQVGWGNVLITPWYLPIGGTFAALLVLYAANRQRRWWRLAIALACVMVACFEWFFLLGMTVLPDYQGPVAEGGALPAFHATLADGTEVDATYFQQNHPTALIFFQGRWCPFCMTQLRELEANHEGFDRLKADVVVVSLEDQATAAETQKDFPHLKVVSDERRELSNAIDLINKGFSPDGGDSAAPTILLLDGNGTVKWLHRPTRFIARPSAAELVAKLEEQGS